MCACATTKPNLFWLRRLFSGHGHDVVITRSDVNEIQLAKSAIRVGIDVLLAECGIDADAIDEFIVAGRFWHVSRSE